MSGFHNRHIQLLGQILELTERRQITWTKVDGDYCEEFEGVYGEQKLWASFIYFARTDERMSDRTHVRFIAFNFLMDFGAGTEGFDLVCNILAHSDPMWQKSRKDGENRLDVVIKDLSRALESTKSSANARRRP